MPLWNVGKGPKWSTYYLLGCGFWMFVGGAVLFVLALRFAAVL